MEASSSLENPPPLNADHLGPKMGPVAGIGSHFLVVLPLKLEGPGIRGRRGAHAQHFHIKGGLRRAKGGSISRDALDQPGVVNRDHRRDDAAITFAEKIGSRDTKMVQQADQVFGALLQGHRTLRDIRRAAMPLEVDREDRMVFNQRRK